MSTQCSRDGTAGRGGLPDAVPLSPERTARLSWELGERVTTGDGATLRGEWECLAASWELAVFGVGDHTAVVRVRTPVGRELFYEATAGDVETALPHIADAPDWEPLTDPSGR